MITIGIQGTKEQVLSDIGFYFTFNPIERRSPNDIKKELSRQYLDEFRAKHKRKQEKLRLQQKSLEESHVDVVEDEVTNEESTVVPEDVDMIEVDSSEIPNPFLAFLQPKQDVDYVAFGVMLEDVIIKDYIEHGVFVEEIVFVKETVTPVDISVKEFTAVEDSDDGLEYIEDNIDKVSSSNEITYEESFEIESDVISDELDVSDDGLEYVQEVEEYIQDDIEVQQECDVVNKEPVTPKQVSTIVDNADAIPLEFFDEPEVKKQQPIKERPAKKVQNKPKPSSKSISSEAIPSNIRDYIKQHPKCTKKDVLKHYPAKDLDKLIKRGSVVERKGMLYV